MTYVTHCFLVCVCVHPQTSYVCPFVFCKHRKQTPKTTKQDGGYVMKLQRSFSNPALMEQNKNTLVFQINSRDSMMPYVLRTKLKYHGTSFADINLSKEDEKYIHISFGVYFTKQFN